ncbi:glycoside hydrolase family 3 protein [Robertkochia aurantiaca]|uniref:glycoside hydrolase family 3 protein n=1 Tax=Robertkochia aurantiaca TaxID=2873700 RepID=UPI001CCA7CBD|nr:glycoside hydrolase family 3 protein [Robertkochia sp. 3YJGBD-33]
MEKKTAMTKPHNLTLEEKTAQLFFPAAFINDTPEGIAQIEKLITDHGIGGLTFFHSRASAATNYEKKEVKRYEDSYERLIEMIERYQKLSSIPLLISIDAEWGLAMRIENTPQFPYALTLGSLPAEDRELIRQVGYEIGKDLKRAGIHYNLAPLADINDNPENPVIGYRSFGQDKEIVLQACRYYCEGLEEAGILNCVKHFPGHGNTRVDSHLGLPVIEKDKDALYKNELYPFRELAKSGIDSIMAGHLAVPALSGDKQLPATLSAKIIKGILRKEFEFEGVVISDALNMHSVSKLYTEKGKLERLAFEAGNDVLCFSENTIEGINQISQKCDPEEIHNSFERLMKMKSKAGLFDGNTSYKGDQSRENRKQVASDLNSLLATKSIINLSPNADSPILTKKEACRLIIIGNDEIDSFVKTLSRDRHLNVIHPESHTRLLNLQGDITTLLAVVPPSVKPLNNFGLSKENIDLIKDLIERWNPALCLFGNPYALELIPNSRSAASVVISGQLFEEYQEEAARVVTGELKASGKLPVELKL